MADLSGEILSKIGEARALYLEALSIIQSNKIIVNSSGIVTTSRFTNKVIVADKFNQAIDILNNLVKTSPQVENDEDFTDLSRNIIEDYEKYLDAEDIIDAKTPIGTLNNNLFVNTSNTQETNIGQTTQPVPTRPDPIPQSEDYTERLINLDEADLKKINSQQNPNQKQALLDDEPDELDTLYVNEEGFVVVPEERRNLVLSNDPDKFRTDPNQRRYADLVNGVDSKHINVTNKNFNLKVNKVFEDDDTIRYNIVIENIDDNCLVIDSIVQIAGTDLSIVDAQTNISEDEKLLNGTVSGNGISTDKLSVTNFVKKYRPDFDTVQSAVGSIPFNLLIPDFLEQVDSKSVILCPQNTKIEEETNESNTNEKRTVNPEQYNINKKNLLPIQAAVIDEAVNWSGYYELGNTNWPVTRLIKNSNGAFDEYSDTKLVEIMKKYQKWVKGTAWCAAFAHSIIGNAIEKINNPFLNYITNRNLNPGVGPSYNFAKRNGLLVNYLVPGCVAYLGKRSKNGAPAHAILILEVRTASGKPSYAFDCKTIEGNSSTEKGVPGKYGGASRLSGHKAGVGGKVFKREGNQLVTGSPEKGFVFLGCVVPKEVQQKANNDYSIFITGNINY